MDIDKRLKALIQEKTVDATFNELKKQRMLKSTKQTAFQKTETLLYNYPKFKEALKSKYDEIEFIKQEGISKRSKSFVIWNSTNTYDSSNEYEKTQLAIEKIEASIHDIENYIRKIDWALSSIQDDPYYKIIPMKYFEGKSHDAIASEVYCDPSTVKNNKNRLINSLQIRLFSDEFLEELLG